MRAKQICALAIAAGVALVAFAVPPADAAATQSRTPVTIRFWNWWDGTRKPLMDKIIEEFEKEYPWITVKSEVQGWTDVSGKIMSAFAAGVPPEVMMARRMEIFALADLNAIRPITDLVKRDGLDLNMFYPAEVNAFRYDGELWSLPLPTVGLNDSFYMYNKELFEQAGLNPEKPPETWSGVLEANRKLTRRDGNGRITQLGFRAWPNQFIPFLYSNNGTLLSPDLRKVAFDSNEGLQAADFIGQIVKMNNPAAQNDFLTRTNHTTAQAFINGKEATIFENISVFGLVLNQALETKRRPDWFGVGLMPYNEKNPKAKSTGVTGISWGWGYVMPRNLPPEKQEAAWLFIKFLTTDVRGAGFFMFAQGRPSPIRKFNENPEYRKLNPAFDRLLRALETEVAIPSLPIQKDIIDPVINNFWQVISGTVEPREAVAKAAEQVQNALDKYWATRKR
ncbi:MAG: ABC transporter substrate-binding protein [Limnochordales bacterium]|nr:ABC transporter substrate-binding protein [Limnochordales bacterium]